MAAAPEHNLVDLVNLYEGYFYPLLQLVESVCSDDGIRQLANELRNCHTHLYWGCHRPGADRIAETEKALNHLLRAVVDEYKMVTDAILALVPPSAPVVALQKKLLAEEKLLKLWDSPASERWDSRFESWNTVLDLGLDALSETYAGVPEKLTTYRSQIDDVRVTDEEAARWEQTLPHLVKAFSALLEAENRFRVKYRTRLEIHIKTHLALFQLLVSALWDSSVESRYAEKIGTVARLYEEQVRNQDRESAVFLLERCREHASNGWIKHWDKSYRDLDPSVKMSTRFLKELLESLPSECLESKEPLVDWPGGEGPLAYLAFHRVLEASFPSESFEAEEVQRLYTVYLLDWQWVRMRALWAIVTRLREYFEQNAEKPHLPGDRERADFLQGWVREAAAARVDPSLSVHVGEKERAVWFFDLVGSSRDPRSNENKLSVYHHAIICFNQARGNRTVDGFHAPFIVNTWGDAMVAVFDDAASALSAAMKIVNFAKGKGIALRFGVAYGAIDVQVNPILGIDAFGDAVNLAARLEPLAETYEILADTAFGEQIEALGTHRVKHVEVKLLKPVAGSDRHSRVQCCIIESKN